MNKSCKAAMLLALVLATARCQGAVPPAPAASANAACQTERGFVDNTTLIPSVATNPISVCGADVKGFDRSRDHRHGGGHVSICVSAVSRSASGNGDGKCHTLRKNSAITPSGTSAAAVDAHPSAGAPPCGSGACRSTSPARRSRASSRVLAACLRTRKTTNVMPRRGPLETSARITPISAASSTKSCTSHR